MNTTTQVQLTLTEDEFLELSDSYMGIYLQCGEHRDSCEPDARNYECEHCGEKQVFGVEELLMEGTLDITQ